VVRSDLQATLSTYFITGTPRSRTAWLANLLTYGPSFCYHDGLRLDPNLKKVSETRPAPLVGNSDSSMLLRLPTWLERFPEARWVFVERPIEQCRVSYRDYFGKYPYPGAPKKEADLSKVFRYIDLMVKRAKTLLPEDRTLKVRFSALDQEETIRAIWAWCVPGVEFPHERWQMLRTFGVNVRPDKF